uniref:GTP-binding protein Rheb n=1 Tax=Rhabditophanes sp. KR3021 TaxID=114890 RepID=A0AC35TYY5_9BILA
MCFCCGRNLHRHQIHLISYGIVSCLLITTGLVFTVFAIFQKQSQIGKIWLAGPTTMVIGLVLCGKVFIDWGPAMYHARHNSGEVRGEEQMNIITPQLSRNARQLVLPQQQMYDALPTLPNACHNPQCKSSITNVYTYGSFPNSYDPTIEDYHNKKLTWRGTKFNMEITDTKGQQEYTLFPRTCTYNIDGFMIIYAINDRHSFNSVKSIHEKIIGYNTDMDMPVLIVANKADLTITDRIVKKEEGEALAKSLNTNFMEVSAKENESINEAFEKLLYMIELRKGLIDPDPLPKSGRCQIQ